MSIPPRRESGPAASPPGSGFAAPGGRGGSPLGSGSAAPEGRGASPPGSGSAAPGGRGGSPLGSESATPSRRVLLAPTCGWCEQEVEAELPGLRLVHARAAAAAAGRSSPPALRERLRELSNRWSGANAIGLRQRPVPAAYRVFYRYIGLDPDVVRTPLEEAMLARMFQGGFHSSRLLADVLLIALVDTGVPVWALDAAAIEGPLGVRACRAGESLGRGPDAPSLPAGQLVVADARSAVAVLFGQIGPDHLPTRPGADQACELELFTLQVPGVSSLHVEEALWMCMDMLGGPWG